MAEEFVQTIKFRVDDSDAIRAIKNLEAKAKEIRFGFKMDPSLARNLGTARGYNGSAVVREERHAAKAANALAVAFDSCRRSVEQFSGKVSKMGIPRIGGGGGGSFSELSSYGKFRDAMMMLPGVTQLLSPVAGVVKNILSTGFSTIQQNEKLQTDLGTLLGDDTKGAAFAERIRNYAGATPYSQNDLSGLAKGLVQYGASMEETEKYMKQVGDIAMGSSQSMQGLGLVLGQVRSQGKLTGQDLMQFVNAGFNPLSVISEATGKSMADLRDMMGKGAISFEMVAKAMEIATSEGGKFYKGAERGSKTLGGMISTLKDNFNQAMAKAWENNMGKVKGVFDKLIAFDWGPVIGFLDKIVGVLSWFVDVAVDVVTWLDNLISSFGEVGSVVGALTVGITHLLSLIPGLVASFATMKPIIGSLFPQVANMSSGFIGLAKNIAPLVGKAGLIGILSGEIALLFGSLYAAYKEGKDAKEIRKGIKEDENVRLSVIGSYKRFKAGKISEDKYKEVFDRAKGMGHDMSGSLYDIWNEGGNSAKEVSGNNEDLQKMIADAMKSGTVKVNVKNTTNQTNNISADFKDIGSLIRENLDQILISHLNFNSNVEAARAAVL